MKSRASAFAVLGLEPGAEPAAIEQAYRRLIKQHHPDREGGDGTRAAEIIHAYRALRGSKALVRPLQFHEHRIAQRQPRWLLAALLSAAALGAFVMSAGPSLPLPGSTWITGSQLPVIDKLPIAQYREPMEEDLNVEVIDEAIAEASHLFRTKDEMALANASRDCHQRLRAKPSTALLDRCAAFDNTVVGLADRDPLRDSGPFASIDVAGRQYGAASAISRDFLAIDSRLDKVMLRVELALAAKHEVPVARPDTD